MMDRIDVLSAVCSMHRAAALRTGHRSTTHGSMESLDITATRAVRHLLANQPTTAAKVTFAWTVAAGPQLGRAATITWMDDGTLHVLARDEAWRREISRARSVITERLSYLLGPDVVRTIRVRAASAARRAGSSGPVFEDPHA